MNKELIQNTITNVERGDSYLNYFSVISDEINKILLKDNSSDFLNKSKEMDIWEKISNAEISETPEQIYPKQEFINDLKELLKK
jgi:hypothetical protein